MAKPPPGSEYGATPASATFGIAADGVRRVTLRSDEGMRNLPGRAFGQVFALGFAFEQFRQDLGDLLERTQELEGARPSG